MSKDTNFITMLGTGNALVTRCYNTCFTLHGKERALLVDAGGGNGILTQLERAGMRCEDIHDLFVTHAHTDQVCGTSLGARRFGKNNIVNTNLTLCG